jgi:hypothetical protein
MVVRIDYDANGKRIRPDRTPSPPRDVVLCLTDVNEFPALPPSGGGTQNSTETALALPSSTPAAKPAAKKQRVAKTNGSARHEPCCPCGPRNQCMRVASCVCKIAGRACTSCDPGVTGKCMNTFKKPPQRSRLLEALERQRQYALHGTPTSQDDLSDARAESTDTDTTSSDGLSTEPAETNPARDPSPSSNINPQPSSDQREHRGASSGRMDRETPQQQQQTGEGEDTATNRSRRASDASSSTPQAGAGGDTATATDEPGTGMNEAAGLRISEMTGAVDPGSIGMNRLYNETNNIGPWDAGYRVMEEDTRMQNLTRADELLMGVYGDTIHLNDGTHMSGGIADDHVWQRRWLKVVSVDLKLWAPPAKHAIGKKFVNMLANELQGVRMRKWNSERAMLFAPVILNRKSGVVKASEITKTIGSRLELWEAGRYAELVNEVGIEGESGVAGRKPDEWKEDGEVSSRVAGAFNSMVLDGKIRGAVRFATGRGMKGPLRPDDTCSKTGEPVLDVLRSKHPKIRVPGLNNNGSVPGFVNYGGAEMTTPHTSSDYSIGETCVKIHGSAGPSGVDAMMLQSWCIRFGTASANLKRELGIWAEWLSNESPPWAAIRALNAKRGVATDKEPGTRPLHVGEAIMRLLGKDLLKTAGDSAKTACGSKQLCAGLEAGVEAGIHAARSSWEEEGWSLDGAPDPNDPFRQYAAVVERALDQNEDWDDEALWEELPEIEAEGASLFDARNGFNELHRYHMLWQVRHRWAKGSRFAFNCYRHFNQVIVRRGNGRKAFIILSEEGLSQGDPLAMILYGVALLPLVEGLRQAVPEATTPWFADDSAAIGNMHKCAK